MKWPIVQIASTAIFCFMISNFADAAPTAESALQEAKIKAFEILGTDTATISFAAGSSELTENERQNLSAIVSAVRHHAVISSAIVAGWSDSNYPQGKDVKLSSADRTLAQARIKSVTNALHGLDISSVETHSMAEPPNWISKLLNTADTKLKGEGKIKNADDQRIESIGRILMEKGGPGKVVVVIRSQGDVTSH